MAEIQKHPASYRDPAGFVFRHGGEWYRQVNQQYSENYEWFTSSGLYKALTGSRKLIFHEEVGQNFTGSPDWYETILPQQIPLISYPYEWSFGQLKDAALLTLDIAALSMQFGMILKDASPYNVQFLSGQPVFIDSLSFERYEDGKPWIAYRQFVEGFLCPLLLAASKGSEFLQSMSSFPEGIPVGLCASLLPYKSRFNALAALHVHLQARLSRRSASPGPSPTLAREKLMRILSHLHSGISGLNQDHQQSAWVDYYKADSHEMGNYLQAKEQVFKEFLVSVQARSALDIGCNLGHFSKLIAAHVSEIIAIDNDVHCIEALYQDLRGNQIQGLLPLRVDIANPSPGCGWDNEERTPFLKRKEFDLVTVLALVHHLAIGKNLPLDYIARTLANLGAWLIIEFVPKSDEKTRLLLQNRKDIFQYYNQENFEDSFGKAYSIVRKSKLGETERYLYLMQRN